MIHDDTISAPEIKADYKVTPRRLAGMIEMFANSEKKRPIMIWSPPGVGKSQTAQTVADKMKREYIDIRALLLDPVDLRGLPWKDEENRTRWAAPIFLPATESQEKHLINLEELPSAPPMVQAALYQLVLDRKCGEYTLPKNAYIIACGNRETDRGVSYRMSSALASRFVHIEVKVDHTEWLEWGVEHGIAGEVLFFIQLRPDLLHSFNPQSAEHAFPTPRTWEFVSDIYKDMDKMDAVSERALYRGTVGEGAAIEFVSFLQVMRDLPHPQLIIDNPHTAEIPSDISVLLALCGSLYRIADDENFESIVTFAERLSPEIGEFLIGCCLKHYPNLAANSNYIKYIINQLG